MEEFAGHDVSDTVTAAQPCLWHIRTTDFQSRTSSSDNSHQPNSLTEPPPSKSCKTTILIGMGFPKSAWHLNAEGVFQMGFATKRRVRLPHGRGSVFTLRRQPLE